jgi:hypothetical protein
MQLPIDCIRLINFILQGGAGILSYYNRSHITALITLYPELKLRNEKFMVFNKADLKENDEATKRCRAFFDQFAKTNQFNPLQSENWYGIFKKDVLRAVSYLQSAFSNIN